MQRKLPVKIAAGAGALVLAGTMVAAAADAPPEAADQGLTTASEHSGLDVPVRSGGATASDDSSTDEAVDADVDALETTDEEADVSTEDDGDEVGAQDAGEHGAAVSALASPKDPETPGREHGEAVSTLAKENGQGGERSASAGDGRGEAEEDATAGESDEATDDAEG